MPYIRQTLSVDEAFAEFSYLMREQNELLPPGPDVPMQPRTPQDVDETYMRFAESILAEVCPKPAACRMPRCRRERLCHHFACMRATRATHPRRPPGAAALRYAIWVYMNAKRA